MAKQSFEKVLDRILNYPHKEKGCSYICGPHLEPCVMVRAHDGDCECRECNANSPFRMAAQEYRQQSGHKSDNQDIQMSHLAKERVKSNKQMTNEVKAAVDRLKAMDSVVIEQFDPDNAIWCDIRLVLTALQSATARADRAEAVLRVYADGKNWKSPKGSMALILWRPNQDFASTNLGYALARKALEGEL